MVRSLQSKYILAIEVMFDCECLSGQYARVNDIQAGGTGPFSLSSHISEGPLKSQVLGHGQQQTTILIDVQD